MTQWLSERIRTGEEADVVVWDDTSEEAEGKRDRGEVREQTAASVREEEQRVSELIPELYLHGLSEGDFDLALRGLLGDDAPLSASTVSRLKERWNAELGRVAWWSSSRRVGGGVCVGGRGVREGGS